MKIEIVNKAGGASSIRVEGQIGSLHDITEFKQSLQRACSSSSNGSVNIYFDDCILLPSPVIGAILQKKEIDKVALKIFVKRKELIDSLQRLRLSDMLGLAQY